ncbi:MAG TPA: hypothetical protein VNL71_02865, partial [Chloroflexota bacterium]|nr:hypothetical protein [Chloroflexota bacterium]
MHTSTVRRDQQTRAAARALAQAMAGSLRDADERIAVDVADRSMGTLHFHSLSPARQRALAHHEAGHAVAELALLPAGSFTSVSVTPRASEHALGILRPAPGAKALSTTDEAIRELMCLAAGGAAEEMLTGTRNLAAEASDLHDAHRVLLRAAPTLDTGARIAVIEDQRAGVKALLRERWPAVQAVAGALLAEGDLAYHDV